MAWKGKIFGAATGFFIGGPLGALVGAAAGHQLDKPSAMQQLQHFLTSDEKNTTQTTFFNTTFLIMGCVAKSDGVVSAAEIQLAEQFMQFMQLSDTKRQQAIKLFNQGKQESFSLTNTLNNFQQHCQQQKNLVRMFLEIQIQIALADGAILAAEEVVLLKICKHLNIPDIQYQRIKRRLIAQQKFQNYRQQAHQDKTHKGNLSEAYAVLELQTTASDAEVKQAYRKQISQHHPDKLAAKGLPEEMMTLAKEKTQQISKAYETIKQARKNSAES